MSENKCLLIISDGGLDDAIAIQYLLSHPKITQYLEQQNNYIDIRCVTGCVSANQTVINTSKVIDSTPAKGMNNIYVTSVPAPYDQDTIPWDGYGSDGLLELFSESYETYPKIDIFNHINADSIALLTLAPFTHAYEILKENCKNVSYIVSMGGSESNPTSEEDMEFNQSLDIDAFNHFTNLCINNGIDFELVTMEECWRNNHLLIDVPENLNKFYNTYKYYCDSYTDQMKALELNTACYDLIAAIKFVNKIDK